MKLNDVTNTEMVVKIRDTHYNCFYGIKVNDMYYAGMRNGKALFTKKVSGAWEVSKNEREAEEIKNTLRLKDVIGTPYSKIITTRAQGLFEIKPIREA